MLSYLQNGGEHRFLDRLVEPFGEAPIVDITQAAIDDAAVRLYPEGSPATRNRQVYTPVSAILKHVGAGFELKRPKGAGGRERTDWLWPEQAFAIFDAAKARDPEFEIFLMFLCYTGWRLSEAIWLRCDELRLDEGWAYLPDSKNDEDRATYLPPVLVSALANHPRGLSRSGTVFRFRKGGRLYRLLREVTEPLGLGWVTYHTWCHTYGTWMRRYGGLDTKGLVATGSVEEREVGLTLRSCGGERGEPAGGPPTHERIWMMSSTVVFSWVAVAVGTGLITFGFVLPATMSKHRMFWLLYVVLGLVLFIAGQIALA